MSSKTTQKGLGRGFDSLLPTDFDESILAKSSERIQQLKLSDITPNPEQPRKHFDDQALRELAASIKRYGIVQPLVVTKTNEGDNLIIAGERRWRAAALAGITEVPVIVRTHEQLEQLEIALIENVQRVDLSPLEQAQSVQRLHEQFSMPYSEIAERLGKASTTVNNIVRLLQLPAAAKKALAENIITEGHARAILALKDNLDKQEELLKNIEQYGWSVRQAEQYVVSLREGAATTKALKKKMTNTSPETDRLSAKIKTPVTIRRTAKGGRLELHFASDKDLKRIIQQLLTD